MRLVALLLLCVACVFTDPAPPGAPYISYNLIGTAETTDCTVLPASPTDRIASYEFRSDTLLDSIGVTYRRIDGSTYNSIKCGGNGGTPVSFPLSIGENIVSFTIKYDTFGIGEFASFTSTGRSTVQGAIGNYVPNSGAFTVPAGEVLVGFRVSYGYLVLRVGAITVSASPPTCAKFDVSKYSAPKPSIVATASGSSVTVAVTMYRQDAANTVTPVLHNLNTAETGTNVCRAQASGDNIIASAGASWTHTSTDCADTYTLTQSLAQIVGSTSNNNWVATLAADGRSIMYKVPIYSTYSVNSAGNCYYVGYRSVVSFRTQLSIASTSDTFITADNSAKFTFSGLRITSANKFEISGKITPLVPNSELRNIALKKIAGQVDIPTTTTTCTTYNVGCDQVFSVDATSLGGAGTDIGGQYDNTMDLYENNVKTRDVVISYQLQYVIPSDPTVVDSDTIISDTKLYTDSTYSTVRTASYATSIDKLYIENAISAASPAIASNYVLNFDRGYLCCVNYLSAISAYNPTTDSGGCRDSASKLEWVDLGPSAATQYIPASSIGNNKKYRLQVTLNAVYVSANHANPMTCQVLLISKLSTSARREDNLATKYVSTVPFLVEATSTVSGASIAGVSIISMLIVFVVMML